ncbi:SIR2 family NAD-dependent protein deacylase [Pseudomonas luteola]
MSIQNLKIVAITGAGLSAESGIPTYRGPCGVYAGIQQELGMPIEKLISPVTLKTDTELFWKYWWRIYSLSLGAQPNKAHAYLKELSETAKSFLEVTQNIDGLSIAGGCSPSKIIELHGSARRYACFRCNEEYPLEYVATYYGSIPMCSKPKCRQHPKGFLRPRTVLFGERIKSKHYSRAMAEISACDALIIIGTELHFGYLQDMLLKARLYRAYIANINLKPIDSFDTDLRNQNDVAPESIAPIHEFNVTASTGIEQVVARLNSL